MNHGLTRENFNSIPDGGMAPRHVKELIIQNHLGDFTPRLNTSSYVNVVSEKEEREVALLGGEVNLADASVYPASVELHDTVVNMLAKLWHAPPPSDGEKNYCGAGTVGSTEACLLAGLAHKFRWRKWYKKQHNLTDEEVNGIRPNLVISTCYQAAWEKMFRYFDVDAKFAYPDILENKMAVGADDLVAQVDEKTMAVVCILGNHYNGVYDPVWDVDTKLKALNAEKGWQVGIHLDAASGGFVAPFQGLSGEEGPPPFDFRLDSVLSLSSSGHKFGEGAIGTGWVVFRQRKDLAEHIAVSVTYLGGHSDSMTLNFSRPATGPYVQFYKLMRLGMSGYTQKVQNQMRVAAYLRKYMKDLKHSSGKPRFQVLDGGDTCTLPVVAARINPDLKLHYDDIDLQHALSESHWYVSGYSLGFENFNNGGAMENLVSDVPAETTMFRIVCKSNLTMSLAEQLIDHFNEVLEVLDSLPAGYNAMKSNHLKVTRVSFARASFGGLSFAKVNMDEEEDDPPSKRQKVDFVKAEKTPCRKRYSLHHVC